MGYKDKKYQKTLHQQAYDKLTLMLKRGEGTSKKDAIRTGTERDKIFSYSTYQTYWKHTKYFLSYVKDQHPDCTNLKHAKGYVGEWLQSRVDRGLSAWTVHTEAKALSKLYGISPSDPDYFKPPERHREDIVRSRGDTASDRHFSKKNNAELIKFCKAVGARREGLTKLCGRDLRTKDQIRQEVDRLENIARERALTKSEQKDLRLNKDALLFTKNEYFVFLKEKGGRERISPIVGPAPDVQAVVERFREREPDEKVWRHVHSNCDVHGYRSDYSNRIYRLYERDLSDIPYKMAKKTGRLYQPDVYHCRGDEKGRCLDKQAAKMASLALGHNRIDVIANNYLRGL